MKKYTLILFLAFASEMISAQAIPQFGHADGIINSAAGGGVSPASESASGHADGLVNPGSTSNGDVAAPMPKDSAATPVLDSAALKAQADTMVFNSAEQMPAAPYDLAQYLKENVKYPKAAIINRAEGVAYISFVVEKNGTIDEVEVQTSSGNYSLDGEAMRVISAMPAWNSGTNAGKPVRVQMTQPVEFSLLNAIHKK
ncbi:MAG TPA: energy transducer TonB [Bacteroidia bacterium]|nr:energy transducer TonB [Bacteroidia bacterium]